MVYTELVYYSEVWAGRFCHGPVDFSTNRPSWLVVKKVSFHPCMPKISSDTSNSDSGQSTGSSWSSRQNVVRSHKGVSPVDPTIQATDEFWNQSSCSSIGARPNVERLQKGGHLVTPTSQ